MATVRMPPGLELEASDRQAAPRVPPGLSAEEAVSLAARRTSLSQICAMQRGTVLSTEPPKHIVAASAAMAAAAKAAAAARLEVRSPTVARPQPQCEPSGGRPGVLAGGGYCPGEMLKQSAGNAGCAARAAGAPHKSTLATEPPTSTPAFATGPPKFPPALSTQPPATAQPPAAMPLAQKAAALIGAAGAGARPMAKGQLPRLLGCSDGPAGTWCPTSSRGPPCEKAELSNRASLRDPGRAPGLPPPPATVAAQQRACFLATDPAMRPAVACR